jgi:hypothetical protein
MLRLSGAFELMFVEYFRRHYGGVINVYPAKSDWATQPSTEIRAHRVIEQNQKTDEVPDVLGANSARNHGRVSQRLSV